MHRIQQGKAQHCYGENVQNLTHIGSKQKLDGFSNILIDAAAFLDGEHDRGKIIVRQNHIGNILCDVGFRNSHSDSDIGGFYGGRIVDTVARHGGHGTEGFPGAYDPGFMLGLHSGVNARFPYLLQKLLVGKRVQLGAGDCLGGICKDPQFLGDGNGGIFIHLINKSVFAISVCKTPLTLFQVSITDHTEIISVRVRI